MMCSNSNGGFTKKKINFQYATIEATEIETGDKQTLCSLRPTFNSACSVKITSFTPNSQNNSEEPELTKNLFGLQLGSSSDVRLGFGESELSEVLDACLESMRAGDAAKFDVSLTKDLDEVKQGFGFSFDVELVGVTDARELFERDCNETLDLVRCLKEKGSTAFKASKVHLAASFYSRALKVVIASTVNECGKEQKEKMSELKKTLHLNLALCQLTRQRYVEAVSNCSRVLQADENSLKALYRRSKANLQLKDLQTARKDCEVLLEMQPDDKKFRQLQREILKKVTEENKLLNSRLRSMFNA